MRVAARVAAAATTLALMIWRGIGVVSALRGHDEHPLLAFPLAVIFPAVLIAILLAMGPTETREGLLMRAGTVLHLLLIMALPAFALYLALGLPVVFLVAEIIETRFPTGLRDRITRLVVA